MQKEIMNDIEGVDFKESMDFELELLKKEMNSLAKQQGLNIDLSDINVADSEEELMAKFYNAMFDAAQNKMAEEVDAKDKIKEKVKKKTKQQLKKEQQAREVEEIQKKVFQKSINN